MNSTHPHGPVENATALSAGAFPDPGGKAAAFSDDLWLPTGSRAIALPLMGLFGNVYLSVLFLLVPLPLFGILRIGLRIGSLGHELLRLN